MRLTTAGLGGWLCLSFAAIWAIGMTSQDPALVSLLGVNAGVQLALFAIVACVPYLRTGRMSYVDLAWPFGVALIGVQILVLADGDPYRRIAAGTVYLLMGLRLGVAALVLARTTGVIFRTEFPRYQYRRMVLQEAHSGARATWHGLLEILGQGFANASVLALPGFLIAVNARDPISAWELVGLGIWCFAYLFESIADAQKMRFITNAERGAVCDVGLWRFSRHPNYFGEWLAWTGLVVAAVPSWLSLRAIEPPLVWVGLGLGTVSASVALYITLVYLTGAVPSEYYSVRKRPGYSDYQRSTNQFFPWFPRQ